MASMSSVTHPPAIEIVIPARNEARRLPEGLRALCDKVATLPLRAAILVVDSASSDATADVVLQWPEGPVPVALLRCDRPGKGVAVRAGLLATTAPFVGFCDADMATDLSALDDVISHLAAGHSLVIGSRAVNGAVVEERSSSLRGAGALLFRTLANMILPGTADTQCGFKFFTGPLARDAVQSMRTGGFAFDLELLAKCRQLGATVTEIPVTWKDMAGSTFSVRRHSAAVIRDLLAIWLRARVLSSPLLRPRIPRSHIGRRRLNDPQVMPASVIPLQPPGPWMHDFLLDSSPEPQWPTAAGAGI
jgi:glycosyltransferase involved in cell wall biosynthesis